MAMPQNDFERPILDLRAQLETLRSETGNDASSKKRIAAMEKDLAALELRIYKNLTPWQRVLISRKATRPRSLDYIRMIFSDWHEIKGDRAFRDDEAVICGLARFDGEPVAVIGQMRGKETRENVIYNFGMMHPEGYRKALRVMRLAERFRLPIFVFIDTPGAYPGIGAEERGQAEAIARNIMEMFSLTVPIIGIVIGEGASGGALGVGVLDRILMLENSWYCVISPEGCASILWRDGSKWQTAAEAMKLTGQDLLELNIVDEVVPEPLGGAHRDPIQTMQNVKETLARHYAELKSKSQEELLEQRYQKYRRMGVYDESPV